MERNIAGNNFASTVVFTAALAAVFAIAVLRFIPFSPAMPESNLDPYATWSSRWVRMHPCSHGNYHPSTDKMTMF
jgi:hypothetical protein